MRHYLILLSLLIILAGCQGEGSPESPQPSSDSDTHTSDLSTDVQDLENVQATATPFTRQPLPPTWTPTPHADQSGTGSVEEDSSQAPAQPVVASGVRAEWTPVFVPTASPECVNFIVAVPEEREILLGEGASASWSAMPGATLYRFIVFDANENIVHRHLLTDTSYQIPPSVFRAGGLYGWSIEALDRIGFPMCPSRGDYFIVEAL